MIMIYPSINAFPVEHMATVPELSYLILHSQLVQAHSTSVTTFTLLCHSLCDITKGGQYEIVFYHLRRSLCLCICLSLIRGPKSDSESPTVQEDPSHHCNYKSCLVQQMSYQQTRGLFQKGTHLKQRIRQQKKCQNRINFKEKKREERRGGKFTNGLKLLYKDV